MMYSRYSIFAPYSGTRASQYEEDVVRLLSLIQVLNPQSKITINELDGALIRTGLSPHLLYEQASAGYYTREIARIDAELGLPVKEVTSLGGYWQDRLIEVGKQHGKPLEETGDDLERAIEDGNAVGSYIGKEELARTIVLLNEDTTPLNIDETTQALPSPSQPAKKVSKTPYYHKKKANWWK